MVVVTIRGLVVEAPVVALNELTSEKRSSIFVVACRILPVLQPVLENLPTPVAPIEY